MTDDQVLEAMEVYGGSFVLALARCFRAADPVNRARLRAAFADIWANYTEAAQALEQRRV